MDYVDWTGQGGFRDVGGVPGEQNEHQQGYEQAATSMGGDPSQQAFYNTGITQHMPCDIKPRLTKEQHDILENHFQQQNKPNTSTKKGFAENLGVSLDKVNNWFQNRRAKSKQDQKKRDGALNLLAHQQANQYNFSSDSETSPAFSSSDYFSMMEHCTADNQPSNGLGISQMQQHHQDHGNYHALPMHSTSTSAEHFQNFSMPSQMTQEMFDSPQEMNRRTLTQEQFDAFAHNGGMPQGADAFALFQSGFGTDPDALAQVFPGLHTGNFKHQDSLGLHGLPPPPSSYDSSIPSTLSDQSMPTFPSSSTMTDSAVSTSSSGWSDSRSSSLSGDYHDDPYAQMSVSQHAAATNTSQWKPGQSVPVDFNALSQEFKQAAQARQIPQDQQVNEQPLAFPADEAFMRRESSASSLTQSMNHVNLYTPEQQQSAVFKSPAPLSSIAARRQRPRPAALGLAAMRSQSYSGAVLPASPGQTQQQNLTPGQPLRRIRSSNVINSVAQGRVQKGMPGAAQRSPLAWTFNDGLNSPKALRHLSQSTSNLAPPTPMSPGEFPRPEQARQHPAWQASGHVSRQPSISETDVEHNVSFVPSTTAAPQNFSSPPHTPMYHQQSFLQHRIGNNVITENTPPQSAPASQQCFPANTFSVSQSQMQPPPQPSQAPSNQVHAMVHQPQHYMNVVVPEQHFQAPQVTFAPSEPFLVPSTTAPPGWPLQYPSGVPTLNAQGELHMAYPSQMQQHLIQQVPPQVSVQQQSQPQQMHTPPQGQYGMFTAAPTVSSAPASAPMPKSQPQQPTTEFFFHEYSPPQDIKRAATPRKNLVDTGPKNYTFANHGPEHFEKGKKTAASDSKATTTASNSPASSSGAASSS